MVVQAAVPDPRPRFRASLASRIATRSHAEAIPRAPPKASASPRRGGRLAPRRPGRPPRRRGARHRLVTAPSPPPPRTRCNCARPLLLHTRPTAVARRLVAAAHAPAAVAPCLTLRRPVRRRLHQHAADQGINPSVGLAHGRRARAVHARRRNGRGTVLPAGAPTQDAELDAFRLEHADSLSAPSSSDLNSPIAWFSEPFRLEFADSLNTLRSSDLHSPKVYSSQRAHHKSM